MTAQNQVCLATFGLCRKYQDDVGAAISTCDQSSTGLASKLKSLTENKAKVNTAQANINKLLTRNLGSKINEKQNTPVIGCINVIDLALALSEGLKQNPASLSIAPLAEQIANASNVVCSSEEVVLLSNSNSDLNETSSLIDQEVETTQTTLEGMLITFLIFSLVIV